MEDLECGLGGYWRHEIWKEINSCNIESRLPANWPGLVINSPSFSYLASHLLRETILKGEHSPEMDRGEPLTDEASCSTVLDIGASSSPAALHAEYSAESGTIYLLRSIINSITDPK
ncbi:hypothetical protein CDAR_605691 [Caerostris darwini]|uniref:Uncharacterized protein n=1 Tax=Caerostris darwini TaxID=1538125 RepID=A0AAV4VA04_9ARAC|nr:hypothetical protein CDAR_605691 [Caerostris darwini]